MNLMIYAYKVGKKEVASEFGGGSNWGANKEGEGEWVWLRKGRSELGEWRWRLTEKEGRNKAEGQVSVYTI